MRDRKTSKSLYEGSPFSRVEVKTWGQAALLSLKNTKKSLYEDSPFWGPVLRILKKNTEASTELGTQAHAPRSLPRSHFIIPQKLKLRLSAKSLTEKLKPRLLRMKDPGEGGL